MKKLVILFCVSPWATPALIFVVFKTIDSTSCLAEGAPMLTMMDLLMLLIILVVSYALTLLFVIPFWFFGKMKTVSLFFGCLYGGFCGGFAYGLFDFFSTGRSSFDFFFFLAVLCGVSNGALYSFISKKIPNA